LHLVAFVFFHRRIASFFAWGKLKSIRIRFAITFMKLSEIQIRDPFVLPIAETGTYYLFGSTDKDIWKGQGTGFDCYASRDLENWRGPIPAFRPPAGFWGTQNFWAPEVHCYQGRFYMFATFFAEGHFRGTQILAAECPEGPYLPWSDGPVTPCQWMCLDGTFHVDADGTPWIVFCQEWLQVHDGAMWTQRLSPDLRRPVGRPVFLFNASEAPWVRRPNEPKRLPTYVTDGPFLHRAADGSLLMLWSSFGSTGYAMGIARSCNGRIDGEWLQVPEPIWAEDGGHGMVFRTFGGDFMLTFHSPNNTPHERAVFKPIVERDGMLLRA
jgi:beta-xylosidase